MNHFTIFGLFLDVVGVLLLGIDLIRFQRATRERAKKGRAMFNEIEEDYGGIESWANEIKEQSRWVPSSSYSRYHVEDEESYNTRHALDGLRDLSSAVNGLAEHVTKVAKILSNSAEQDERLASSSFRVSIFGLFFLIVGFGLQILGAGLLD